MNRSTTAMALALVLALMSWRCEPGPPTEPPRPVPAPNGGTMLPGPTLHRPPAGGVIIHNDTSRPGHTGGGGSQTETLTGGVVADNGAPVPGVRVKLFPSGYDPSLPDAAPPRVATTDDSGRFVFDSLDTAGYYNLVAGLPAQRSWAFAESLQTRPGVHPLSLTLATTFRISMHSDKYATRDSGIAYFPGTDILTRCNGFTASLVDSVPLGLSRMVLRSLKGWQHNAQVPTDADTVTVMADPNQVQIRYKPRIGAPIPEGNGSP